MNRLPRVVVTLLVLIALTISTNIIPVRAATIWIVTNLSDSGTGSLRYAIENSLAGDTVTFDPSLSGQTIITSGIAINHNLAVDGSALALQITISGNDLYRVFNVSSGITVTLNSLIITHGKAPYGSMGGGILSAGVLTITNSTISESSASYGGGIFNQAGTITLINSTISKNNASMHGGGIKSEGGSITLSNVTFSNNKTTYTGGAVYNQNGTITVSNSIFSNNIGDPLMSSYAGGIYNIGIMNINDSTFSNNSAQAGGGAIFHSGGTLTITNSIFSENSISGYGGVGGGIENNDSLTITNSSFSNNSAQSGGAIYNNGTLGILTVKDSTFSDNSAQDGSGIFNYSTLEVTNCTFSGNGTSSYSSSYGGGISNYDTATIIDSAFLENFAYNGGGIHNWDSLTVKNSTFYGNEAAWGGGLFSAIDIYNNSSVTITNSVFAGNSAVHAGSSGGGGVYISSNKTHIIENTTISGNSVSNSTNTAKGGGIYLEQFAMLSLNNVTITNNTSQGQGGGIFKDSTSVINFGNNIIAGNNASNHTNDDCSGAFNSLGYNLIQVTTGCTINGTTTGNIIGSPPELAPLGDYGGSTPTHALLPTSPALDSADNATCESQDQRGITRPQDGDNDTSSTCDMGAYEHEYESVPPSILTISRASTNPTSTSNVDFTVTFSEGVQNVDVNDFSLFTLGVSGASITSVTPVSASVYTVAVNTGTGSGTIRLDVPDTASIKDLSNNDLSGLPYVSGETYTITKANGVNVNVTIGGTSEGNYDLAPSGSDRQAYAGVNNGPAQVTGDSNILASTRVLFGNVSYSEMMGFPADQLTNEYVFPYYNNTAMDSQLRVSNLGGVDTTINVYVGSSPTPIDTYTLAAGAATRKNYAGVNNGPMRVTSSATNIITTIRVLYGGLSYSELVGFPANQLTNEYIFPYYNNVAMDSQLRVSNMGGSTTTINVYVGSSPTPIDTYALAAGGATRKNYAGVNSGPLRVTSSATNILTTVRVLFGNLSYSELLGFPVNQLTTSYSYPIYDNVSIDSQLRVSNVGNATTTITVYSGSTQIDSYSLAAGAATRINYSGVDNGPLRVVSSTQPILTTTRMLYLTSGFSSYYEMTGMPDNQLHTEYVFPYYNNTAMNSQVRFAVP